MPTADPFSDDPPLSLADAKARLTDRQEHVGAMPLVALLGTPPAGTPPHFSAWAVGPFGGPRQIVVVPTMTPDAPPEVIERVVARVLAIGTGRCPLCSAVVALRGPEPVITEHDGAVRNPAAWGGLPLVVDVPHAVGCPATFGEEDRRWFEGMEP